ncbi:hypothetical protein CB0940_06891 [Cercospora beticola]|uniref:Uncharacterized protein n=1 Tax=Cercospora beticola TaxID=122368 RepID=A0A2G5H7W4_CERBT|nr:hypothetical protein CB0940_06891 [Cercospora beticola]PIA88616.1 hypothetical protein CB0940_06891 [Cercospora beticola]WPB02809.1 hypothetical protein RHO25_007445 [Cercospora beticola]
MNFKEVIILLFIALSQATPISSPDAAAANQAVPQKDTKYLHYPIFGGQGFCSEVPGAPNPCLIKKPPH